ncbi:hypothetical protein HY640_03095 [Candidatus Woesearchaeota archaeon]|nr:hypothetical protein [Candidatus Woesearchaeota archaeon]
MAKKEQNTPQYKILLVAAVIVAIGMAFQFSSSPTGLQVLDNDLTAPKTIIQEARILDTTATFRWTTDENAESTFKLGESESSFSQAKEFAIRLDRLQPGKQYSYQITTCDAARNCNRYANTFTTLQQPPARTNNELTGAATTSLNKAQSSLNKLLFLLLLVTASLIVANAFVQRIQGKGIIPPAVRMSMLLRKSESLIKENKHYLAYPMYSDMRQLYENLKPAEKGTHKKRILDVYSELAAHAKAQEANVLVDKYLEGNITKPELGRLRELLEG